MIIRQKINKINLKNLFLSETTFKTKLEKYLTQKGYSPIFIGRARYGFYLACRFLKENSKKNIVITSAYTILDVNNCISASGKNIEFYTPQKNSFYPDLQLLEKRFQKKDVAAFIITYYHTNFLNLPKLKNLCIKYGVVLIEDCAITYNSKYIDGQEIGLHGDISIFSNSLFKFNNFFYGGFISVNSNYYSKKLIKSFIKSNNKQNIRDYIPQLIKYCKFKLLSNKYFYSFVIWPVQYIENLINTSYLEKKIINDPFVPYTKTIPANYKKLPANSFYKSLYENINKTIHNHKHRLRISKIYYKNLKDIFLDCGNQSFDANGGWINFPILLKNIKERDLIKKALLIKGYDVSIKMYRNCKSVQGYSSIPGNIYLLKTIIDRIIFLPTHLDVRENDAKNISKIINRIKNKND